MNRDHEDNYGVVDLVATEEQAQENGMNGYPASVSVPENNRERSRNHHTQNDYHSYTNTNDDDGEVVPDDEMQRRHDASNNYNNNNNSDTFDNSAMALRPLFFGNLLLNYSTDQIKNLFEHPESIDTLPNHTELRPIPIDRIDIKRGYCFVFFKDATSIQEKERIESFCMTINGINVPHVSRAIRAEFARGDGRVKRVEDERRKNIAPSETLFVVNFHENTTRKEDLELLFEPFGKLLRIDMKRNYAFVQYATIAEATAAKEATNGGKLDQSVLTVEYVARQRDNENRRGPRSRYNNNSNSNNIDRNRSDRGSGAWNNDRGPSSFGGTGGTRYDLPPSYDDRGRSSDRDRGRSEYRSTGSGMGVDPYFNRPTIYDNDRYSDRRASRESPPPPPPPVSSSYPYNHHRSVGRSRSRSPPPPYRRRYPDEEIDRVVRDDYRGSSGVGGVISSSSQYERRGSGGGGGAGIGSDHYPRRSSSPTDRYRVSGSSSSYNDRETRGYR